jgi:serine/threonine protein kinase
MEMIAWILQTFAAAHDVIQVSDWVMERVRAWGLSKPTDVIEKDVDRLTTLTDAQIRAMAAKVFGGKKSNSPEASREELLGVLLNLSRNVRYQRSVGSLTGSSFRSERLIELMLRGIEPVRYQNEPVSPGSPWILKRHLGMGSFGEVWMAENKGFPIPRAYKFFLDGSGEWLRREQNNLVAILKRLGDHELIVEFLDVNTQCEHPHLAFEYVGGGSLEDWIVEDPVKRAKLEPLEIIRQVASALAAAHSKQIAHRDIKPSNILLTKGPDVRVKLGDFGLAQVSVTTRPGESQYASFGGQVGTAMYLPPEAQVRTVRRDPKQDDVFALGVVWYQMALGKLERPPYNFAQRLSTAGVDPHTIGLIEKCLAHPAQRFPNAQSLEIALEDMVPDVKPCKPGEPDVQHLVREYLSVLAG